MLSITNITGDTEHLTNVGGFTLDRRVNGDNSVNFFCVPDDTNAHSFPFLAGQSTFEYDGRTYVIKQVDERNVGHRSVKTAYAIFDFFDNLRNSFEHAQWSESQTFSMAMTRVFAGTQYTFNIVDTFPAQVVDNFGRDNRLSLFKTALELYGAEFSVSGNIVTLKREIGANIGFQLRWGLNVKSIDHQTNTRDLATRIKGYGGKPDDNGVYPIVVEYVSPNASIFGDIDATAIYNEGIDNVPDMLAHLEEIIVDEPQLSITVDIAQIREGGEVINEGDYGYIIYEPMGINVEARVVAIKDEMEYREGQWVIVKTHVTLSNIRGDIKDVMTRFGNTSKGFSRLMNGQDKLPFTAMDNAVANATRILVNDNANFEYAEGYVQGINTVNPNFRTRLTSQGFGVTKDGGQTYPNAITHEGVVTEMLTAGAINTGRIVIVGEDNYFYWDGAEFIAIDPLDAAKYVRITSGNIHVAKGAITIERPDGAMFINNGMPNLNYNVQSASPPHTSQGVTVSTQWFRTDSTVRLRCDLFSFRHEGRYLKVSVAHRMATDGTSSGSVHLRGLDAWATVIEAGKVFSNSAEDGTEYFTFEIDLGVPTYQSASFYLELKTGAATRYAYTRLLRAWQEG